MLSKKTRNITFTAMFAALTCAATMMIRFSITGRGYVNLGDCIVNISGWLLGGAYGAAAAGVGSALADVLSGYMIYAPATLIIKAAMAMASCVVFSALSKRHSSLFSRITASVSAEIIMVAGYAAYEAVIYGSLSVTLLCAAGNAAQAVMGVVSSVALYEALVKRLCKSKIGIH